MLIGVDSAPNTLGSVNAEAENQGRRTHHLSRYLTGHYVG